MIRRSSIFLVTALLTVWSSVAFSETSRIELSDASQPVRLQVELEWGSIRIAGVSDANVVTVVSAPDQQDEIGGSLVALSESTNLVTVRQAPLESGSFRSANLEITVPRRSDLELTMNRGGDIWVHDVDGLVEVTNLNGSVELSGLSKAAAVNASNGSISAAFAATDPALDMIFTSLNGSIELCLPAGFSGRVDLTTAGDRVRSDFAIASDGAIRTVSAGESIAADQIEVSGTIGSGGAALRASTLNGEIALRRCEP